MILVAIGMILMIVSIIIAVGGLLDCYDFKRGLDNRMFTIGLSIGVTGFFVMMAGIIVECIRVSCESGI
jgi:hypothetical protein